DSLLTGSFLIDSPDETFQLGKLVGSGAGPNEVWCLTGPLGAGKTHFVKGLAAGLGFEGPVTSPTFNLQHVYPARVPLYHFDWYRLEKPAEVEDLGWREWVEKGGVTVVEGGDKFPQLLPERVLKAGLELLEGERRRVILEAVHPDIQGRLGEILKCWPL
ncbi:MAG TPA: tRNA (adenosine(37)-N6)-threonylcarbamoyltransferase complex ATPase subunit type 1 TsaE, partial [bacterium]|nr:tRNA (adenosine(37)-N6)-threonylcarbamoyltransferase complex ATPase subunit type 1 TsaE [bacterium]